MKKVVWTAVSLAAAVVASTAFAASAVAGTPQQEGQARGGRGAQAPKPPSGPAPRLADGHPDLSGIWGGATLDLTNFTFAQEQRTADRREELRKQPPAPGSLEAMYQPWALAKLRTLKEKDDPVLRCIPYGVPRGVQVAGTHLMQIESKPGKVIILYEYFNGFRIIPTDGRKHPDDTFPTYLGDSVGHWEGDTLVVDVTDFNDKTWLAGQGTTGMGTFHSDRLHVIERWHRVDADTLEFQATIEDPKVLTGPWTSPIRSIKHAGPDRRLMEALCFDTTSADLTEAAQKDK